MKITVNTNKSLSNFNSRQVRNYMGSIAGEEFKDTVMWHERAFPPIIYAKPLGNRFEIYLTKNNESLLKHIADKINENRNFYGADILKIIVDGDDYYLPEKSIHIYKTLTPLVIAANTVEFKIIHSVVEKHNIQDFTKYLISRIKSDLEYQTKSIGVKIPNIMIKVQDFKFFKTSVKEGQKWFPAIKTMIISDYNLPEFIGYKVGLGFGRIIQEI